MKSKKNDKIARYVEKKEIAISLYRHGVAIDIIARATKVDNKVVEEWLKEAGQVID